MEEQEKVQSDLHIDKIKKFLEKCPLLKDGKINVDYLKDDIGSYSIDRTPTNPLIKKFTSGGGKYQITFDFCVNAPIDSNVINNLANSRFCEDFMKWIKEQNSKKNLPEIDGAFSIECTSPRIYFK